jgi:hypothetical protein
MNKLLMTGLYFVVSKLLQGSGTAPAEDLTKLKIATMYLHAVKISRLLALSLLGSGACLIFLLMGLILIHGIIFFYVPWTDSVKITITLICAVSYLLIAGSVVVYFFAEDRWAKMLNTEALIKELVGKG